MGSNIHQITTQLVIPKVRQASKLLLPENHMSEPARSATIGPAGSAIFFRSTDPLAGFTWVFTIRKFRQKLAGCKALYALGPAP